MASQGTETGHKDQSPRPQLALSWAGSQGFLFRAAGAGEVGHRVAGRRGGNQGPGLGGLDPRKAMDHPEA